MIENERSAIHMKLEKYFDDSYVNLHYTKQHVVHGKIYVLWGL